jgi:hypothetical protein
MTPLVSFFVIAEMVVFLTDGQESGTWEIWKSKRDTEEKIILRSNNELGISINKHLRGRAPQGSTSPVR